MPLGSSSLSWGARLRQQGPWFSEGSGLRLAHLSLRSPSCSAAPRHLRAYIGSSFEWAYFPAFPAADFKVFGTLRPLLLG